MANKRKEWKPDGLPRVKIGSLHVPTWPELQKASRRFDIFLLTIVLVVAACVLLSGCADYVYQQGCNGPLGSVYRCR